MVHRPRLSLVWNGRAGIHTRRAGLGKVVGDILARPPNPQRVYDPRTLAELEETARHIHRDMPNIVAIAGGDGTIHRTLTAILRNLVDAHGAALPEILIIPVGTMNNVASALGATRFPPVAFAERIVAKINAHVPLDYVHAYPLRVNGEYGFLYGAALPVHLLERYYAGGTTVGAMRGFQIVAGTLLDELLGLLPFRRSHQLLTKPVHARVVLPVIHGAVANPPTTHTGLMVAAIDQVGVGCRAMPDARKVPGKFMVRSTQLSFLGLIGNLLRIWTGQSLPSTFDAVTPKVIIEYTEPTVTMVDGDLKPPTTRDVIECGPMLKFIIG